MTVQYTFASQPGPIPLQELDLNFSAVGNFTTTLSGGVQRTIQSKAGDIVSAFDFMSAAQIADVQAGTLSQDVTAALNTALQATLPLGSVVERVVWLPPGKYLISGTLYVRLGCGLLGSGGNTTTLYAGSSFPTSGSNMVLAGWGLISGVPTFDSSNGPSTWVQGIFFTTFGIVAAGCVFTQTAGYRCEGNWFSMQGVGIGAGGSDGYISNNYFDYTGAAFIAMTCNGQRNRIVNNVWDSVGSGTGASTPGIQIGAPDTGQTITEDNVIANNHFFACSGSSIFLQAAAVVGTLMIDGNRISTSIPVGGRYATQSHILTQSGATFNFLSITNNTFNNAKASDIYIGGGASGNTILIKGNTFTNTGVVDGGGSYAITGVSINGSFVNGLKWILRDNDFINVGGPSFFLSGSTNTARISNCHKINCGTGGLSSSANDGDKSHFQIHNGATDVFITDCSTDATNLYVAGTYNTSYFQGRNNYSNRNDYDTQSATAGGTYIGERHNQTNANSYEITGFNLQARQFSGTAAPVSGTYRAGDIVYNTTLANSAGQTVGWLCVVAGSPGTWRTFVTT